MLKKRNRSIHFPGPNHKRRQFIRAFFFLSTVLRFWTTINNPKYFLVRLGTPEAEKVKQKSTISAPFSFSACLLTKDDNLFLPEWLAYHFTFLPLRRLIVAVDPHSPRDPQPIFDLYKLQINITVWRDDDRVFWKDGEHGYEKSDWVPTSETKLEVFYERYKLRQRLFYSTCLRQLKKEGQTWTAILDSDEFLSFNYYDDREGSPSSCNHLSGEEKIKCDQDYQSSIREKIRPRDKLKESATAAEHIHRQLDHTFDKSKNLCTFFGSYAFTAQESNIEKIQRGMPHGFNASDFHTLRYHHRVPLNKPHLGKSIIDVSRYDGREFLNKNRPLGNLCTKVNPQNAAFRIHHYIGSWDMFRTRGFNQRALDEFQRRNKEETVIDNVLPEYEYDDTWLSNFVNLVGEQTAYELTAQIRLEELLERQKSINDHIKANKGLDWGHLDGWKK